MPGHASVYFPKPILPALPRISRIMCAKNSSTLRTGNSDSVFPMMNYEKWARLPFKLMRSFKFRTYIVLFGFPGSTGSNLDGGGGSAGGAARGIGGRMNGGRAPGGGNGGACIHG